MAIAVTGTAMLTVTGRWWSEAACDRFAVRQAGPAALHAWAAAVGGRQGNLPRLARVKGLLTHPPLALRTALHPNTSHQDTEPRFTKNRSHGRCNGQPDKGPNLAYSSPENRSHADCRVIRRAVPMRAQVTFRSRRMVTSRRRLASV